MDTSIFTIETSTENNDENIINSLADDMCKLEKQILPQLDELSEKIPELYKGYANLVRTIVSEVIKNASINNRNVAKINMAAEIAARGLQAYGFIKDAQKHNALLDKFMQTKQTIAYANISRNNKALAEAKTKLESSSKLMKKYATTCFKCKGVTEEILMRQAFIVLRVLNLYRTSLFLVYLSEYLNLEYSCWIDGNQTSGKALPDYYLTNEHIFNELFTGTPFRTIELCCDKRDNLTGAEIMLLSDYQLSLYALKDNVCTISVNAASPEVKTLMTNNSAFTDYKRILSPFVEYIKETPGNGLSLMFIITLIIIIALCIFYIPGSWWLRVIIGFSGFIASCKIYDKNEKKLQLSYCQKTEEIIDKINEEIELKCGRIRHSEFDYEKKDLLKIGVKGFLGI